MKMVAPFTVLTGRLFSASIASGLLLSFTSYSNWPILAVPGGTIWFCAASAPATSSADSPLDCSASGSRSIWICRTRPP
jgi:hypothetical protein